MYEITILCHGKEKYDREEKKKTTTMKERRCPRQNTTKLMMMFAFVISSSMDRFIFVFGKTPDSRYIPGVTNVLQHVYFAWILIFSPNILHEEFYKSFIEKMFVGFFSIIFFVPKQTPHVSRTPRNSFLPLQFPVY